jgi:hypothetical protein
MLQYIIGAGFKNVVIELALSHSLSSKFITPFMPRKKRKTSKVEINLLYRKCQYCQAHRTTHFFDRHESACKAQWIIRNENHPHPTPITMAIQNAGAIQGGFTDNYEFMEGCNAMQIEDTVAIVETDSLDTPWAGDAEEPIPSE